MSKIVDDLGYLLNSTGPWSDDMTSGLNSALNRQVSPSKASNPCDGSLDEGAKDHGNMLPHEVQQGNREFHVFNNLAPEIRLQIWERHFVDNVLPPPHVHHLMQWTCWKSKCAKEKDVLMPFFREESLEFHLWEMHEPKTQCPVCAHWFNRHENWLYHIRQHAQYGTIKPITYHPDVTMSPDTKQKQKKSLFPLIPLISREAWAVARTSKRRYEHINLSFVSGTESGELLRRPLLLANWDTDALYIGCSVRHALKRHIEILKSTCSDWTPRVQRLVVELTGLTCAEPPADLEMRNLLELISQIFPRLREVQFVPCDTSMRVLWNKNSSCPRDIFVKDIETREPWESEYLATVAVWCHFFSMEMEKRRRSS